MYSSRYNDYNHKKMTNTTTKYPHQMLIFNEHTFKQTILSDLTKAIQQVQQFYVEKNSPLTNSDLAAHVLCEQLDCILILGLKQIQDSYWKFVHEFTHKNVNAEINSLLNVATNFGRARAWLYHALNDSLIESYFKCILSNKKLVNKYYIKDKAIISDEQVVDVLVNLTAGLEHISFRLHNDVPYLDHSCCPPHLTLKITENEDTANTRIKSKKSKQKTSTRKNTAINNVSLDSTSSTNYSELYLNDSEFESGIETRTKNKHDEFFTSLATTSSSLSSSEGVFSMTTESIKGDMVENEILKLRKVAAAAAVASSLSSSEQQQNQSKASSNDSSFLKLKMQLNLNQIEQDENNFDKKINACEDLSTIIEDATSRMHECVQDMTKLYENYDNKSFYIDSPVDFDGSATKSNDELTDSKIEIKEEQEEHKEKDELKLENRKIEHIVEEPKAELKEQRKVSITSFDETLKSVLKQEVKIDNNTKLILQIDILQKEDEELIKMYHVTRGHSTGELEEIYFLITTYSIYILHKSDEFSANYKYIKEAKITHDEIDFIEISINSQAFHIVCVNRRKEYWFTTACRSLTNQIMASIQTAREQSNMKLQTLSILDDPITQRIAIKKFISSQENITMQDFDLKYYSLLFWEDQVSATTHLIQKEGYLLYAIRQSSSVLNSNFEWKKAYFILKNDVLSQFKSHLDKRAFNIIKLNGEDFSGCRKSSNSTRQFTIELILSNNSTFYLSAKNETEQSEWLQAFCKIISLGSITTDVPGHSCLPCSCVITNQKLYYCHEDLTTNFYRLLDSITLQEMTRISFDNNCPYFCILYADSENKKQKYWFVYFTDELERNSFINALKNAWEDVYQIPLTIDCVDNKELLKRCKKGVELIHNTWNFTLNE